MLGNSVDITSGTGIFGLSREEDEVVTPLAITWAQNDLCCRRAPKPQKTDKLRYHLRGTGLRRHPLVLAAGPSSSSITRTGV